MDEPEQADLLLQLAETRDRSAPLPPMLEALASAESPPDPDPLTHAWEEATDAQRGQFFESIFSRRSPE